LASRQPAVPAPNDIIETWSVMKNGLIGETGQIRHPSQFWGIVLRQRCMMDSAQSKTEPFLAVGMSIAEEAASPASESSQAMRYRVSALVTTFDIDRSTEFARSVSVPCEEDRKMPDHVTYACELTKAMPGEVWPPCHNRLRHDEPCILARPISSLRASLSLRAGTNGKRDVGLNGRGAEMVVFVVGHDCRLPWRFSEPTWFKNVEIASSHYELEGICPP